MNAIFKKPFFVSLCLHLSLFSLVSFSFRPQIFSSNVFSITYFGGNIPSFGVIAGSSHPPAFTRGKLFSFFNQKQTELFFKASVDGARKKRYATLLRQYLKPNLTRNSTTDKSAYSEMKKAPYFLSQHKTPVFIFHPILPTGFSLYFKDRQLAHVELSYRMSSDIGSRPLPVVKRKISSGNLEVDLLCKRYITNYLFAQRLTFAPSGWQVVKIDLSGKDDER